MSSILENRIFYHWRLANRGGVFLAASLVAACAAGAFIAIARHPHRIAGVGLSAPAAFGGFVALAALAGLLWWRFSSLQDEMFHRIQNYSYGWGGTAAMAVMISWGIAFGAGLAPPIDPIAPLVVFAVAKSFFWTVATRKWL